MHAGESGPELHFRQMKTRVWLELPMLRELREAVEAGPTGELAFLVTARGVPFTPAGFGNWFRECCDAAGLHNCSAHGLRKAASRRFAHAGFNELQIMAWTGHQSSKEVMRYTKSAKQRRLADQGLKKMERERNRG